MASRSVRRSRPPLGDLAVAGSGVAALLAGTALGWNGRLVELIVAPPPVARFALAGAALAVAFLLLGRSVDRLGRAEGPRDTIRGVRFAFLALAAAAGSGGWLVGSPLPIVAALVIGGVDVVETTFLLAVTGVRRRSGGELE